MFQISLTLEVKNDSVNHWFEIGPCPGFELTDLAGMRAL